MGKDGSTGARVRPQANGSGVPRAARQTAVDGVRLPRRETVTAAIQGRFLRSWLLLLRSNVLRSGGAVVRGLWSRCGPMLRRVLSVPMGSNAVLHLLWAAVQRPHTRLLPALLVLLLLRSGIPRVVG